MKFSEGKINRTFVIRLEDGDHLPDALEDFARQHGVARALCVLIGGIDAGSRVVVGPQDPNASPIVPTIATLGGVHEVAAIGTLFPDESGQPKLHMHAALGRGEQAKTGCIRPGVDVWKLGEVVLLEIVGNTACRKMDQAAGFLTLHP